VLASIRPKIAGVPIGSRVHKREERVRLKIEDCSPAGLKMFMNRQHVSIMSDDEERYVTLSNAYVFDKSDIDRLLGKAGVKADQLTAPTQWRRW
jgi:hypothetical protein